MFLPQKAYTETKSHTKKLLEAIDVLLLFPGWEAGITSSVHGLLLLTLGSEIIPTGAQVYIGIGDARDQIPVDWVQEKRLTHCTIPMVVTLIVANSPNHIHNICAVYILHINSLLKQIFKSESNI